MVHFYNIQPKKRRSFLGGMSVNRAIILINVVAFILFTLLLSSNVQFLDYIALKPSSILQLSFLWTFLTSMFMHGGFFHLFVNMLSLFFIGSLVEKILGPKRYLWVYLATGLFAGLFFVLSSLIFTANLEVYAVGASGYSVLHSCSVVSHQRWYVQ